MKLNPQKLQRWCLDCVNDHDTDHVVKTVVPIGRCLQHCWARLWQSPTSRHVKMLRGGKILSVGGEIVANML